MTPKARLVWQTAGLSLLALLPFLAHVVLLQVPKYRPLPPRRGQIAELIARGEFAPAYRLTRSVEQDDLAPPKRAELAYQQAVCERHLDRPERAYERLLRLQGALPALEEYRRFWMARTLEEMGERGAAIGACEDFLLTSGNQVLVDSVSWRLAQLYTESRRYVEALQLYERLRTSAPDGVPEVLHNMARVHELSGNHAAARQVRLQLVQDHPGHHRALRVLASLHAARNPQEAYSQAVVYLRHSQNQRAAQAFQRFLEAYSRHPLAPEARYLLGRAYYADRQYDRAEKAFERAVAADQHPLALYNLGHAQVRLGRDADAIASYVRFVQLFPRHELAAAALWQAAKAAERNDRFDPAEALYRQLTRDYPESDYRDEATWNVGFMHYCRREDGMALGIFRQLSRDASEPHMVDQSLFWAAKTAHRQGLEEQAASLYADAARGFPRSYYSARAASLGYGDSGLLEPRPRPVRRTSAAELVAPYLERADALQGVGLTGPAEVELARAESLSAEDPAGLKVIRDRYEALGLLDRALALSKHIYTSGDDQSEFHRLYPDYYWEQIVAAAREAQIDPFLVLSVIRQESSFRKDAVSGAGAAGLMQIMPKTGRLLARRLGLRRFQLRSLFEPAVSIRLGSRFLSDQVRQFRRGPTRDLGVELGLAAYNAGPQVTREWVRRFPYSDPDAFVERIPYKETRHYVKLVLKNYTIYKALSEV